MWEGGCRIILSHVYILAWVFRLVFRRLWTGGCTGCHSGCGSRESCHEFQAKRRWSIQYPRLSLSLSLCSESPGLHHLVRVTR